MPSTRRKAKRRGKITGRMRILFTIGAGWNQIEEQQGLEWIKAQWAEHGRACLNSYPYEGKCWAEMMLGAPEEQKPKNERIMNNADK